MPSSTRPPDRTRRRAASNRDALRRAAAERIAAERRRRRTRWAAGALATALVVVVGGAFVATRDQTPSGGDGGDLAAGPVVGGDLHTVTSLGDILYVGGHAAVAASRDEGRRWKQVPSLAGADAMGWAVTGDAVLVGGHPGLFRSTDDGATFARVTGAGTVPDVHALGGAGGTVYLASPQAGVLVSTDGGKSWEVRSSEAGRSFMGTILVDPDDPARLVAPDMASGLTTSTDGGRTWTALGGPMGAMAATWKPTDTDLIIAVGMNGGARSADGGATWRDVALPRGTSAVSYDPSGDTVYAGVLERERARTYRSTDDGATWTPTG